MTVYEARKQGYKVRVNHVRDLEYILDPNSLEGPYIKAFPVVSPKGGKTVVEVRDLEGNEKFGVAYCHKQDNYNKKIGTKLALERALSPLND